MGVHEAAGALDDRDGVPAQETHHALAQACDDVLPPHDRRPIVRSRLIRRYPELRRMIHETDDFGAAQHRLRWDTPEVEAHPADLRALDDGAAHAKLGRADRRGVAARAGAEDEDV